MADINHVKSKITAVSYKITVADRSIRKARTRTLIQAGGLLNLVGYFAICGIEEGQDLQLDFESRDKAATLLGILSEAFETLPMNPSNEQLESWKNIGIRVLKMSKSKDVY